MSSPPLFAGHIANDATRPLWKVWWLWGIPVGWTTSGMMIAAELSRNAGYWGCGNLLDVARLLVYVSWARLAWRCSRIVENRQWAPGRAIRARCRVRFDSDVLASRRLAQHLKSTA